eukprot:1328534-Ditylum_brightwellii.AAC.1
MALWYTKQDEQRIQHSIKKTIIMMQRNGNSCGRCIRGLEHLVSPELMEQSKINLNSAYWNILKEQHRQRVLGINDMEEMRIVSSAASQWARNKAFEKGGPTLWVEEG